MQVLIVDSCCTKPGVCLSLERYLNHNYTIDGICGFYPSCAEKINVSNAQTEIRGKYFRNGNVERGTDVPTFCSYLRLYVLLLLLLWCRFTNTKYQLLTDCSFTRSVDIVAEKKFIIWYVISQNTCPLQISQYYVMYKLISESESEVFIDHKMTYDTMLNRLPIAQLINNIALVLYYTKYKHLCMCVIT